MDYRQEDITFPGTYWEPGPFTISAHVAVGTGLCYHAIGGDSSRGWAITHLASKKALCKTVDTEYEVKMLMEKVVNITDWTQSEKELLKHPKYAVEFLQYQQTIRQDLNQRLEAAMKASNMADWLVEEVMNELANEDYPIMRKALLYAFKIIGE